MAGDGVLQGRGGGQGGGWGEGVGSGGELVVLLEVISARD